VGAGYVVSPPLESSNMKRFIFPDYDHYLDDKRFAKRVDGFNQTKAFIRDMDERKRRGEMVAYTSVHYENHRMPSLEKIDIVK